MISLNSIIIQIYLLSFLSMLLHHIMFEFKGWSNKNFICVNFLWCVRNLNMNGNQTQIFIQVFFIATTLQIIKHI